MSHTPVASQIRAVMPTVLSVQAPPRRRMRVKTTPAQQHLQHALDLDTEAGEREKRQVYLVTFPHPRQATSVDGVRLVAPSSMSKDQMLEKIRDAFAHPVYRMTDRAVCAVPLSKLGVWREKHQADSAGVRHEHDHVAVLGQVCFRFLAVKRALLANHGLASHWSATHTGYWSCVRYMVL